MPEPEELIELRVLEVRVAVPAGNGVEAGLVILEEATEPYRRIQMYVGQHEARAIHVAWSNTVPPRPSTWDLFVTTLSLLEASIRRVVITDVEDERHFFARVDLERLDGGDPLVLSARPSDALALALRAYRCEIAVRPEVLDEVGALADGTRPPPPPRRGSTPAAAVAPAAPDQPPADPYEAGYEYDSQDAPAAVALVAGDWAAPSGASDDESSATTAAGPKSERKKSGGKKAGKSAKKKKKKN